MQIVGCHVLTVPGIIIVTHRVAMGTSIGGLVGKGYRGFVMCTALPSAADERVLCEEWRQHTAQIFLAGMGAVLFLCAVTRDAGIPAIVSKGSNMKTRGW